MILLFVRRALLFSWPTAALVSGALLFGCSSSWQDDSGIGTGGDSGWAGDDDPSSGDDDDTSGSDDDDAGGGGDDDTSSSSSNSYPDEEAFFALAVGNTWLYDEEVSGDVEPVYDDVEVTVVGRMDGPDFDPPWAANMVIFELEVYRLFSGAETHWYGLDGSGELQWVKSRIYGDFLEYEDYEGDGGTVLRSAVSEFLLVGENYEGVMLLPDIEGHNYAGSTTALAPYLYGSNQEAEALENEVTEGGNSVGFQYFKGTWGLLGFDVATGSTSTSWEIDGCSHCPSEAGL